jgi:hypothetical protein
MGPIPNMDDAPQTPWKIQMQLRNWKQWKRKSWGTLLNLEHFEGVLELQDGD